MTDQKPDAPGEMTAGRIRSIADALAYSDWPAMAKQLRAHADSLEAREKAGVDAEVEGMQTKEWREKLLAEACTSSVYSTNAYFVLKSVIKSHDICERALRDARAVNLVLWEALRRLLPIAKACKHEDFSDTSGNEDTKTAAIQNAREALAQQPPQAGGEQA